MGASPDKSKVNKLMTLEKVQYAKVRCLGEQELELELEEFEDDTTVAKKE